MEHGQIKILPFQEYLLKAALLSGRDAKDAWSEWRSSNNLDTLDHNSIRLLPLIYRNLNPLGLADPSVDQLKRHYQAAWYKNQITIKRAASMLTSFHQADIPTLLLKGIPLTVSYYQDYGVRPMADFDILVPIALAMDAVKLIIDLGGVAKNYAWSDALSDPLFFEARHEQGFLFEGYELDLHWHVHTDNWVLPGDDSDYWDASIPFQIHKINTRTMNPTDLLLHVCVHGATWNSTPMVQWVADASYIYRVAGGEINWDRLINQARKHDAIQSMYTTLSYLVEFLELPVPKSVLLALGNATVPRIQRIHYQTITQAPSLRKDLVRVWIRHHRYEKVTHKNNIIWIILRFPRFLRYRWGIKGLWGVIKYGLMKSTQGFSRRRKGFRTPGIEL